MIYLILDMYKNEIIGNTKTLNDAREYCISRLSMPFMIGGYTKDSEMKVAEVYYYGKVKPKKNGYYERRVLCYKPLEDKTYLVDYSKKNVGIREYRAEYTFRGFKSLSKYEYDTLHKNYSRVMPWKYRMSNTAYWYKDIH